AGSRPAAAAPSRPLRRDLGRLGCAGPLLERRTLPNNLQPVVAAAWLAIVVLTGSLLVAGRNVLIPLAVAVLIWQLVNATAERLHRIRIRGRAPRHWEQLVLGVAVVALALWLVVDLIVSNVGAVSASAPTFEANLLALLPRLAASLGLPPPASLSQVVGEIDLDVLIRSVAGTLASFAGSIGVVGLYVGFMLLEQASFDRKIDALFPAPGKAAAVRTILGDIENRVERYLWIKTLMSVLTAVLSWAVLAMIGCQNASFWALVVFMVNYIPFLGTLIGVLFPSLLVLVQFGSFGPFLAAVLGLGVIQFAIGSVLDPRLMGSSLNLSPLAILVSLAVWGGLWGVAGMFLCVPIMVIIMIVCAQFTATKPLAVLLSATGRVGGEAIGAAAPAPQHP
ncbi:MAG TPA: AI-2E family transporter, partial [Gaiellales bacterium]|nr:AI-2E family transporter [Gaiellales bacterium]